MQANHSLPSSNHVLTVQLSVLTSRAVKRLQVLGGLIPPTSLVLLSSFAIQMGNVYSKSLFDALGSSGTVFICKLISTALLLGISRPRLKNHSYREYFQVVLMGVCMAGMSLAYFAAIARIPLGIAAALGFLGPLGIAVIGSRQLFDLIWVVLAAVGVFLLAPVAGVQLDPIGLMLAIVAAGCWAAYIMVSVPVGRAFSGGTGLALAIAVATVVSSVPGILSGGAALLSPMVLGVGLVVAVFGTVLPYSLEFNALRRIPPRTFGVLISIEPAIAAIVGFLFLKEVLEFRTLIAIVCITAAAVGVTLFGKANKRH
jgi:inner membrane transporter RhtA